MDRYGRKTPGPRERAQAVLKRHGGQISVVPAPTCHPHSGWRDLSFKRPMSPGRGDTDSQMGHRKCIRSRGRTGGSLEGLAAAGHRGCIDTRMDVPARGSASA